MNIQLCTAYSEKAMRNITYPCMVQEKLDGARIVIERIGDQVMCFSRAGNQYCKLTILRDNLRRLPEGYVYDGELLFGNYDRKTSNGLANKSIQQTITPTEADLAHVILWDMVSLEGYERDFCSIPYHLRYELLQSTISTYVMYFQRIFYVPSHYACNFQDVENIYKEYLKAGGEGVVVKNKHSVWESGRSNQCVKMKAEKTIDLKVIEIKEGQGKNANMAGALHCVSSDGKIDVWVGSGLTDAQRRYFWLFSPIGKIVEVKYNTLIQDKRFPNVYSLNLPRYVRLRLDKTEANSLEEVI